MVKIWGGHLLLKIFFIYLTITIVNINLWLTLKILSWNVMIVGDELPIWVSMALTSFFVFFIVSFMNINWIGRQNLVNESRRFFQITNTFSWIKKLNWIGTKETMIGASDWNFILYWDWPLLPSHLHLYKISKLPILDTIVAIVLNILLSCGLINF